MKEMTKEIIEKLDDTEEIKQMKELRDKLNKNEEYLSLIDTFLKYLFQTLSSFPYKE